MNVTPLETFKFYDFSFKLKKTKNKLSESKTSLSGHMFRVCLQEIKANFNNKPFIPVSCLHDIFQALPSAVLV